jgi:Tol biopolymer transport system component
MPIGPGSRLDAFEIVALLGSGGMGEVWLARDLKLERQVALKVLPPDLTQDPSRVARFQQEARAASALNHPNVCTIYALGETPDGQQFIAMEYVEGDTLRQGPAGRPVTLGLALDVAVQIASALTAAHAAGVVHRDLKPENVMLRPDGIVKVLDFGLAKLMSALDAKGQSTLTAFRTDAGRVVGTVDYMSPEQARGQIVDARTDVWSLGVLLYEMVAGRTPFAGSSSSDVLAGILDREPPPLARFDPSVPAELERLIGKTLRKDREQRYQVMKDLLLDLQALRDDLAGQSRSGRAEDQLSGPLAVPRPIPAPVSTGVAPRPQSGAEHVVRQLARHKVAMALVACVLALSAGGAWWAVRSRHGANDVVRSTAPVQRTLTRLTSGSGLQTDVTWSPDGRFIAYAADRTGNFDIWVQSVGGGDPVQVTRSAAQDTQPDWSPDGSTLVFRSERDGGGLFLVPALGGVERQLTSFGSYPFWSPDNSEILFVDEAGLGSIESPLRLFAVPAEEGPPRAILADFLVGGSWSWIARHPDGRISVLGHHRQLGRGFFTMARDGTRLVQSKESPDFPLRVYAGGGFVRRRFRWHPSGSALYVQTESNGVSNLWRVRVDPNTLRWVSAERLTTGVGPDVTPALSRDGTRLAFSTEQQSARLWVFPLDPVARRLGTGKPVTEDDAKAVTFDLSPDGQSLAYTLKRPGIDRTEVWITNIVDGTSQLVAPNAVDPCWSPDGKAIAYHYAREDRQPPTGRVAVRQLGGQERFISRWSTNVFMDFDWSAEPGLVGTYLVFPFAGETSLALWPTTKPDADKPERVLISKPKTGLWQGHFSPNGRWLSFVAIRIDRPSTLEIAVAPADGARPERWIRIAADHTWPDKPRWAPDGRTLYFLSRHPTSYFNLWAVRFDPERGTPVDQPFALTQFDSPSLVISPEMSSSDMDVSSHHAVLTIKTVTGSIWMLDNVDK